MAEWILKVNTQFWTSARGHWRLQILIQKLKFQKMFEKYFYVCGRCDRFLTLFKKLLFVSHLSILNFSLKKCRIRIARHPLLWNYNRNELNVETQVLRGWGGRIQPVVWDGGFPSPWNDITTISPSVLA